MYIYIQFLRSHKFLQEVFQIIKKKCGHFFYKKGTTAEYKHKSVVYFYSHRK